MRCLSLDISGGPQATPVDIHGQRAHEREIESENYLNILSNAKQTRRIVGSSALARSALVVLTPDVIHPQSYRAVPLLLPLLSFRSVHDVVPPLSFRYFSLTSNVTCIGMSSLSLSLSSAERIVSM